MESDLCSVLIKNLSPRWSVYSGSLSAGWGEPFSPYSVSSRRRRETPKGSSGGGKKVTLMVSTITIQAKLQDSIAASRILARTASGKGIYMALIQEPWYRENCIRGLSILGYTLHSAGGTDRLRACVLVTCASSSMLPGFSGRDLVVALVKYLEDGTEMRVVIYSVYLPYDSEDSPSKELEELVRYCEEHHLIVGCDSNVLGVALMVEGKPWWNS
jgi:hypothetical protein